MKTNTTISLDTEVKTEGLEILKEEGVTLSFWVERSLRNIIKRRKEKEVEDVQKK